MVDWGIFLVTVQALGIVGVIEIYLLPGLGACMAMDTHPGIVVGGGVLLVAGITLGFVLMRVGNDGPVFDGRVAIGAGSVKVLGREVGQMAGFAIFGFQMDVGNDCPLGRILVALNTFTLIMEWGRILKGSVKRGIRSGRVWQVPCMAGSAFDDAFVIKRVGHPVFAGMAI